MTTKINLLIVLSLLCVGLISCGEPEVPAIGEAPSEEPTPTPTPTPLPDGVDADIPENAALFFRLGSRWEGYSEQTPFEKWQGCELANSPTPMPGSPSTASCQLTIPEGQMYHSDIEFKMGTRFPELCPVIEFQPYYYRRSTAAISMIDDDGDTNTPEVQSGGYIPPGKEDRIDCQNGKVKECWGGAAPSMLEKFPEDRFKYFLTLGHQQTTFVLKSENSLRYYGGYNVNYLVTNDLNPADRLVTETSTSDLKERVSNTYRDHNVRCKNYWGETLFSLTIIISDENMDGAESGTAHDDYPDWN